MQIIENDDSPWITAIIDQRWIQAKLFNEPSSFGINNGRISKLAIMDKPQRDRTAPFVEQLVYNYDRGLDFNDLPQDVLDSVVEQLEALPETYTPNV